MKLINQPTGNSCGPTCLMMILESHGVGSKIPIPSRIDEICEMCGTDWIVGTPPDRLKNGMEALELNYIEYISTPRPFELLDIVLSEGSPCILRTITKGVPHWIIVQSKTPMLYNVLDPWLGEIQYYKPELDAIWKPRNYHFFEMPKPTITEFSPRLSVASRYGNIKRPVIF